MATETPLIDRSTLGLVSLEEFLDLHLNSRERTGELRDAASLKADVMLAFGRWLDVQRRAFGGEDPASTCEILMDSVMTERDAILDRAAGRKPKSPAA